MGRDRKLKLTGIHPFTKAQGEALQALANSRTINEAAQKTGRTPSSIKGSFYGNKGTSPGSKTNLGVKGIVERVTGVRTKGRVGIVARLRGDVLLDD